MISVIIGIYNGAETVERAVLSVLNGTYRNIEVIAIDDGSTDNTSEILQKLASRDSRLKVYRNAKNVGLAATLNRCLDLASGEYIARQDADDLSHPMRLEKELAYLTRREDLSFVGTSARLVHNGKPWGIRSYPSEVNIATVLRYNPFIHPTMLFRRSALVAVNGYLNLPRTRRCEDYDLVFRLYAAGFKGGNTKEILFDYEENPHIFKRRKLSDVKAEFLTRVSGEKELKSGMRGLIFSIKPVVLRFIPAFLYKRLHKNFC